MMTDLELTRLCAEAMGYTFNAVRGEAKWPNTPTNRGEMRRKWKPYDPLHDDAQAMALVKKHRMWVHDNDREWIVEGFNPFTVKNNADLNRAIVECCAVRATK